MIELVRVYEIEGSYYYSDDCSWWLEDGAKGSSYHCATMGMGATEREYDDICHFNKGPCFIKGELHVVCSKANE